MLNVTIPSFGRSSIFTLREAVTGWALSFKNHVSLGTGVPLNFATSLIVCPAAISTVALSSVTESFSGMVDTDGFRCSSADVGFSGVFSWGFNSDSARSEKKKLCNFVEEKIWI